MTSYSAILSWTPNYFKIFNVGTVIDELHQYNLKLSPVKFRVDKNYFSRLLRPRYHLWKNRKSTSKMPWG
jgi:hypothetical protein